MPYTGFTVNKELFVVNEGSDNSKTLPPGMYTFHILPMGGPKLFKKMSHTHDTLVDLPGTAYDQVTKEIVNFLNPTTKQAFTDYGFLYKRSSLLYGPPGTGKTCIVNRVATDVVNNGGVVIFNPNPGELKEAFNILDDLQPEVTTMVIFEELDKMLQHYEGELLNLLDGEVQKNNVVYLATTNFIDQIPTRIRRPGRFSTSVEVDYPTHQARIIYLDTKLKNLEEANQWAELTEGFSVDELKELVLSVKCLGYSTEEVIPRIRSGRAGLKELIGPQRRLLSFDDQLRSAMNDIHDNMEKMSIPNIFVSDNSYMMKDSE